MPLTYDSLQTVTIPNNTNTLTISGIPTTFTDLRVVFEASAFSSSNTVQVRFNGDTGTNYNRVTMRGDGSSITQQRTQDSTFLPTEWLVGAGVGTGFIILDIFNYASTTAHKTILWTATNATSGGGIYGGGGLWRNTAAITSLALSLDFANGSRTFGASVGTVFGIRAA